MKPQLVNDHGLITSPDLPFGTIYHTGSKALFSTNIGGSADIPRASDVVLKNQRDQGVAFWGETNNFPQQVLCDIEKSDIIPTVLEWKAQTLVGEGIVYGNMVEGPGGAAVLRPAFYPEMDEWFRRTEFDLFYNEAAYDFYRFANTHAELQLNAFGDVMGMFTQDQSWLRYQENNDRGEITKAYLSAHWDKVQDVNNSDVLTLPALDPYYDLAGQIQRSTARRMIVPIRFQGGGRKYYALAPWNGLRASGWMDLAIAIPKMKLRLLQHMMQIRYWIEIADSYWPKKFGVERWKNMGEEEKQKAVKKEVADFEALMSSEEEVGKPKAVMTRMSENPHAKEMMSLWKINVLPFTIPEGAYVEDSQETDFHLVRGLGVDPALVGISPGKNSASAGSGSADRVKRTNYLLSVRSHGTRILSPLNAIAQVNGWNDRLNGGRPLTFMFRSLHTATLDRTTQVAPTETGNTTPENGPV